MASSHFSGSQESLFSISEIEDALECVICLEFPKNSPVYQCENGHVLCNACHGRVINCPSCRVRLGRIRCLAVEKVIAKFGGPCKFSKFGCNARLPHELLPSHETMCDWKPVPCPSPNCKEIVPVLKMSKHLERWANAHELVKGDVGKDTIMWGCIMDVIRSNGSKKLGIVRLMLDDRYFLCLCWRNSDPAGRWYVCIYALGSTNEARIFEYKATLKNSSTNEEYKYKGPCLHLGLSRQYVQSYEPCLTFSDEIAKRICENDTLTISFEVRRIVTKDDV